MDNEYYDDMFEREQTKVEQKTNEYMEFLREAVRQEVKDELQTLRAEVETLREFKRTVRANEAKFAEEKRSLERDIRNARLRELFGDYIVEAWRVKRVFSERPKCDKCNEGRMIEFISPRGKRMTEWCECAEKDMHYEVDTAELVKVENCRLSDGGTKCFRKYFLPTADDELSATNDVYDGTSFEDISFYAATSKIFLDEQKCRDFCDYLNKKTQEWNKDEI